MKNLAWYAIAVVFAVTLGLAGTSSAAWFGSDKEAGSESSSAPAASETVMPAEGEEITLSGTVNDENQFVAADGEAYALADNDRSLEIKTLVGKQLEIKGTVMEEEGQKTVEVIEYTILE